ncbi:MAG: M1 family aminopeptidase [Gammaproteobacteria bacterium]
MIRDAHSALHASFLLLAGLMLAACQAQAPESRSAGADPGAAPDGRLPGDVVPQAYRLELTVRPARDRFSGQVDIALDVRKAVDGFWMHGQRLDVGEADLILASGKRLPVDYTQVNDDGVVRIELGRQIAPQRARLVISYSAGLNPGLRGLYSVREGGDAYAFTQFESTYARLAFPAFDEPGYKTPFDLILNVPRDQVAIGNTPEIETTPAENGLKRVRFARTRPLPTYLVALAVGPLDVVEAPDIPPNAVRERPLRLRGVTARGKSGKLDFALAHAGEFVALLEEYFDIPYPYRKLDIIAVPDFSAGAMENVGAHTFREELLLEDDAPVDQRRRYASVMAHELAHNWFGNLVTMQWWDDLWLNEAFATWMAYRTVEEWNPEYQGEMARLKRLFPAMDEDTLGTARKIRQPITGHDDIVNAFDGITYGKGGAVLEMFEHYLGAETFRDGVRDYLTSFADGNATADDFITAIARQSSPAVGSAFRSFLTQGGLPVLDVALDCSDPGAAIAVSQSRYLPLGSSASPDRQWGVPACMRMAAGGEIGELCVLVESARATHELASCPDWLMPNADFAGYYQWRLPPEGYRALNEHAQALTATEQFAVARSIRAAFFAGEMDTAQAFELLRPLAFSPRPEVASAPMPFIEFVLDHLLRDTPALAAGRREAAALYRQVNAAGAFDPAAMAHLSSDADRVFLIDVAVFKARWARDPAVREEAAARGRAWLGTGEALHPDAVSPEGRPLALEMAVQVGGADIFQRVLDHFMRSRDALFRGMALKALGRATDPELARRARELALNDALRDNEIRTLLAEHFEEPDNRDAGWAWFEANIEALIARMPPLHANGISRFGEGFCSEEKAAEVEAFLQPYMQSLTGGPRNLAKSVERIRLCAATVAQQKAGAIARFRD